LSSELNFRVGSFAMVAEMFKSQMRVYLMKYIR